MRPGGPDPEGWRKTLMRAASTLLDEATVANPWLGGPAGRARPTLVAVGVATVDWERAAGTLGDDEWQPLPRDPLLGAAAHGLGAAAHVLGTPDVHATVGDGPLVLLLEPDAEGPLAASLARFGEGLAVVYARPAGPARPTRWPGRRAPGGPLGPALLVPGPAWGPHVVALLAGATIGQ